MPDPVAIIEVGRVVVELWTGLNSARQIAGAIINTTPHEMRAKEDRFAHGRWASPPAAIIPPGTAAVFSAVSSDGSIATGVEGLVIYESDVFSCFFLIDNPFLGSAKSHAAIANPGSWKKENYDEYTDSLSSDGGEHVSAEGWRIIRQVAPDSMLFTVRR